MSGLRLPVGGAAFLLLAASALAGPPRGIDEISFNRLTRVGPFSTELQGKVTLRVPTGYRIVLEDKLPEFGELTGYPVLGDEAAYITMAVDKPTWHGLILLLADDPLKGIDRKTLGERPARDQLLDWQRRFHEGRRPRKGATVVPSKVGAWTHPPKFNDKTNVLTMGVRLEAETEGSKDKVCYCSFVYGDHDTIVCVVAYTDVEDYDKAVKESGKLTEEFAFLSPQVSEEAADEDPYYTAKVAGGGLLGSVVVLMLFRALGIGASRPPVRKGARRPVAR
jgi:hypothetical protein